MQSPTAVAVAPALGSDAATDASVERANVRVVLKVRPPNEREVAAGDAAPCIDVIGNQIRLRGGDGEPRPFTFDCVMAGAAPAAAEVYQQTVGTSLMPKFVAARNTTLFCYGQTGAGKTYCVEQQILPQ